MRSFLSGLALALLGLVALVVTAEFLLRATGFGLSDRSLHTLHELRLDRPWLYGLRPGIEVRIPFTGDAVYRINQDGFRDRVYAKTREPGTFRIALLGNSVAFGYGVEEEDLFTTHLEELLSERHPGTRFEVLNFAVSGYNAYNQATFFADRGVEWRPDLVLVQFSVGGLHDPTLHFDAQTQMHLGMIPEEAFPDPSKRHPPPAFPRLVRVCSVLRTCALFDQWVLSPIRRWFDPLPKAVTLTAREMPPGPERRWLRARYGEIEETAESIGAEFAVVVFPYSRQVHEGASGRLQEQLTELGREEGWPVLDLLPGMKRAAQDVPLLYIDDWHVNEAGHRAAAEVIADQLESYGLLPRSTGSSAAPVSEDLVDERDGLR